MKIAANLNTFPLKKDLEIASINDFHFTFNRAEWGRNVNHLFGGVLASTWVLKHKEHTGEYEDLDKNIHFVIGNDYALAA